MLDEAKHPFLELGDVDAPPNKTLIMIGRNSHKSNGIDDLACRLS